RTRPLRRRPSWSPSRPAPRVWSSPRTPTGTCSRTGAGPWNRFAGSNGPFPASSGSSCARAIGSGLGSRRWTGWPTLPRSRPRSPIGGVDPHELRALRREARVRDRTRLQLVDGDDGGRPLADGLGERLGAFRSLVQTVERAGDGSEPLDSLFFRLWTELPYFRDLVAAEDENRRELDAVSAFAATLARFVERRPEASVEDYLITLDAAEFGPDPWIPPDDRRPDAVRIVSAHRAQGREFEAVIVAGCLEGEFPSLGHRASLVSIEALAEPQSPVERI